MLRLFSERRHAEAETLARSVTARFPLFDLGWTVLGATLAKTGRPVEALMPLQQAIALSPGNADAHGILGDTLMDLGRPGEAEASYRRALEIRPDLVAVHCNLGGLLRELGRLEEAEACYRHALQFMPTLAEAHGNLGVVLRDLGRLEEAEASYRRAVEIMPAFAEAHCNLGNVLRELGRFAEAEACYRRALQADPSLADAHSNLALLLGMRGDAAAAFQSIVQSLQIRETPEARGIFVDCVKRLHFVEDDDDLRAVLVRALAEPWGRPEELAEVCTSFVKLAPDIAESVKRANEAWPRRLPTAELYGSNGLATIAADPLLHALLDCAPVCDIGMERFLTAARSSLLDAATGITGADADASQNLDFHCALARQCFINEYVYSHTDEEAGRASALRDSLVAALEAGKPVPALWPVAVAAYFPLGSLPVAARLCDMAWPDEVVALLAQQIREPETERQLRSKIPQLTRIEDEVSLRVRDQYEENPYPRWVRLAPGGTPKPLATSLRELFPLVTMQPPGHRDAVDVLVAGCGTGQHPIETAQRFRGARVLAVDLSLASLAYAMRKTREMGLSCIEYAQADLLELGSLERRFDVIESVGVLHHLADPFAGWRILLSLLRPGGFMRLGFYSEVARRDIVRVRKLIAERGYGSSAEEIRRCRQELVRLDERGEFASVFALADFYSTSTCRDLLFHVQERRMTLTGIEAFLNDNGLALLGFAIDPQVVHAYRLRFPEDRAAVNLAQWQGFENDNPGTFLGMYQFWVQKLARA